MDEKDKKRIDEWLEAYINGHASLEEQEQLEMHFADYLRQQKQMPYQANKRRAKKRVWSLLVNDLHLDGENLRTLKRMKFRVYWLAAASLLVISSLSILLYWASNQEKAVVAVNDIAPGSNRATLTLGDGRMISLDSVQNGIIVNDEDIKYSNGNKVEGVGRKAEGSSITMLTLSTPRGGQYQIILEDGTKVWLNAASTLKYPSKFTGDRREVELEGEAYFLVAKSQELPGPFIVKSRNQSINVLGTEFNVAAYADEISIKTTLVNGAVKVSSHGGPYTSNLTPSTLQLSPGEQSIQSNGNLTKAKVDVNSEIDWRNGLFSFNDEPLEAIMRKIARWYNVEVVYQGANKQERFGGGVSRYDNVSTVLKRLETAGHVHFKIEAASAGRPERRILVMD